VQHRTRGPEGCRKHRTRDAGNTPARTLRSGRQAVDFVNRTHSWHGVRRSGPARLAIPGAVLRELRVVCGTADLAQEAQSDGAWDLPGRRKPGPGPCKNEKLG